MTLTECILCLGCKSDFPLQKTGHENFEDYSYQEYINICKTYLTVKIKSLDLFGNGLGTEANLSCPMCTVCFPSVQKLFRIHKKLEATQTKLNEFASKLSEILLNRRRRKEIFVTVDADSQSVKLEFEEDAQLPEEDDFLLDNLDNIFPEVPEYFSDENEDGLSPFEENDYNMFRDSPKNVSKTDGPTELKLGLDIEGLKQEKNDIRIPGIDQEVSSQRRSLRMEIKRSSKSRTKTKNEIDGFKNNDWNDGDVFECKKCHNTYTSEKSYKNHLRLHTRQKNHRELLRHHGKKRSHAMESKNKIEPKIKSSSKNENNIFKCDKCDKTFKQKIYLIGHQNVHTTKRSYACEICKKAFKWSRNLVDHKKCVHFVIETKSDSSDESLPVYSCCKCDLTLNDVEAIKVHFKAVHSEDKLEKPYPCEKCDKSFSTVNYLRIHQKVHSDERNHVCEVCSKAFRWAKNLVEHRNNFHSEEIIPCQVCGEKLIQNGGQSIETHMKEHHPGVPFETVFVCETCGETCETAHSLRQHKKSHVEVRDFVCEICTKAFKWKKNLAEHKRTVHTVPEDSPNPVSCDVCNFTVPNSKSLEEHMSKEHPGHRPHICETCGKSFAVKTYLQTHRQIHTSEKGYICDLCGKAFNWRKNLVAHRKTVHAPSRITKETSESPSKHVINTLIKPQSCSECGKTLASKSALQDHLRLHTGETPFLCEQDGCKMKFRTLENLKRHKINAHTTDFPFACDQCDSSFKFKNQLTRHKQAYHPSIDKLHICDLCGKTFKRAYGLKDHMRSHNDADKLNCELCEKRFTLKSSLVAHVKLVHTQEVSFVCDICGKRLSSKIKLDDHKRTHTKEKPFECADCFLTFVSKTNLCKHRKIAGHFTPN